MRDGPPLFRSETFLENVNKPVRASLLGFALGARGSAYP